MTYVTGYPPNGSTLGNTKSQIRTNLDSTFATLGEDHYNNNGVNGALTGTPGYHTQAHFPNLVTAPNAVSGTGIVYTKNVSSGTELFYRRASNASFQPSTEVQITGKYLASANGYTFLPNGIIMQWGVMAIPSGSSSTGTVSFSLVFPTAAFTASLSLVSKVGGTSSSSDTVAVRQGSLNTSGFTWDFNGNSGSYTFFYYFAIGN